MFGQSQLAIFALLTIMCKAQLRGLQTSDKCIVACDGFSDDVCQRRCQGYRCSVSDPAWLRKYGNTRTQFLCLKRCIRAGQTCDSRADLRCCDGYSCQPTGNGRQFSCQEQPACGSDICQGNTPISLSTLNSPRCGCDQDSQCGDDHVCDLQTNTCVRPCELQQCSGTTPVCINRGKNAVCGCTSDSQCGNGSVCDETSRTCIDPCDLLSCSGDKPVCIVTNNGATCGCDNDTQCADDQVCDEDNLTCVDPCSLITCSGASSVCITNGKQAKCGCIADSDCGGGLLCDNESNSCVDPCDYVRCPSTSPTCIINNGNTECVCLSTSACPSNHVCDTSSGTCVPRCQTDINCPNGQVCDYATGTCGICDTQCIPRTSGAGSQCILNNGRQICGCNSFIDCPIFGFNCNLQTNRCVRSKALDLTGNGFSDGTGTALGGFGSIITRGTSNTTVGAPGLAGLPSTVVASDRFGIARGNGVQLVGNTGAQIGVRRAFGNGLQQQFFGEGNAQGTIQGEGKNLQVQQNGQVVGLGDQTQSQLQQLQNIFGTGTNGRLASSAGAQLNTRFTNNFGAKSFGNAGAFGTSTAFGDLIRTQNNQTSSTTSNQFGSRAASKISSSSTSRVYKW